MNKNSFLDFLRMRQQMGPLPTGSPSGDHRMDQVEAQRGGQYGMGVYPRHAAPGMICFEDGSCVTAEEYAARQQGGAIGGTVITPQPTGRPASMPGTGNAFAAFLANRMARGGQGGQPIRTGPTPSPSMDPRNVVCDERGENCRHVYLR